MEDIINKLKNPSVEGCLEAVQVLKTMHSEEITPDTINALLERLERDTRDRLWQPKMYEVANKLKDLSVSVRLEAVKALDTMHLSTTELKWVITSLVKLLKREEESARRLESEFPPRMQLLKGTGDLIDAIYKFCCKVDCKLLPMETAYAMFDRIVKEPPSR